MSDETPTTKARKQRKRVTTEFGQQLLRNERKRLIKEQAALGERLRNEAQGRLTRQHKFQREVKPEDIAVARGLLHRVSGALASEGVTVPIHSKATSGKDPVAYTDFRSIDITYPRHWTEDVRLLAANLRGLGYHEGGHCRWTVPFLDLAEMVGVKGQEFTTYHPAWNLLEDQRMETAVVTDSPRKAAYFTTMVLEVLCGTPERAKNNWPLLIWRRYVPTAVRKLARRLWVAENSEDLARQFETCVSRYVLASDARTMWTEVSVMHLLLKQVSPPALEDSAVGHQHQYGYNQQPDPSKHQDKLDVPIDPTMQGEGEGAAGEEGDQSSESVDGTGDKDTSKAAGGASKPTDKAEEDEDGALDGEGQTYANERPKEERGDIGGSSGEHTNQGIPEGLDYNPQRMLDEALQDAKDERNADKALDADVKAYHEARNNIVSRLAPYQTRASTNAEAKAVADNLAQDLEESFRVATADKAPGWVEQQRRGIVNVMRYETRRPGDVEFFRAWTDSDQPGSDIAVSILLDYSVSMSEYTDVLAQAGYAAKVACSRLDIPCTVVLWDSQATTLFDANDTADYLPVIVANGGTDPRKALADLDNQVADKTRHLVVVMTDGAWSGGGATNTGLCASHDAPGRYFLGLAYNQPETMETQMRSYGFSEVYGIKDLMAIPRIVADTLETWARE